MYICVFVWTHIYVYINIHTYIYIYIYTYTPFVVIQVTTWLSRMCSLWKVRWVRSIWWGYLNCSNITWITPVFLLRRRKFRACLPSEKSGGYWETNVNVVAKVSTLVKCQLSRNNDRPQQSMGWQRLTGSLKLQVMKTKTWLFLEHNFTFWEMKTLSFSENSWRTNIHTHRNTRCSNAQTNTHKHTNILLQVIHIHTVQHFYAHKYTNT